MTPAPPPEPTPSPTPGPAQAVDCAGNPGGTLQYDDCGICDGDNACLDCCGVPYGKARYDACGVCDGFDECYDCAGVLYGTAMFDRCGECNGSNSCLDCEDDDRDVCGICGGKSDSCVDCAGTPFGSATFDVCGVCNGDSSTCRDCAGMPLVSGHYQFSYDACDVCGGSGNTCKDCAGIPNGPTVYDACDVCGGGNACVDCTGVPYGVGCYDECDVCNGDGTTCLDCEGVPFGTAVRNRCGLCEGTDDNCEEVALADEITDIEADSVTTIVYIIMTALSACVLAMAAVYLLSCCGVVKRLMRPSRKAKKPKTPPAPQYDTVPPAPPTPASKKLSAAAHPPLRTLFLLALVAVCLSHPLPQTGAAADLCARGLLNGTACTLYVCDAEDLRFLCGEQNDPRRVVLTGDGTQLVSGNVLMSIAPTVRVLHLTRVVVDLSKATFARMHHLKSLVIDHCSLIHPNFLSQPLGCNKKLEVLQVTNSGLVLAIGSAFLALQNLRTLRIRNNPGVTAVQGPGFAFKALPFLETVDLRRNNYRPTLPLRFGTATKFIHLDGNEIQFSTDDPDGIEFSAPVLVALSASDNQISGPVQLLLGTVAFPNLQTLQLANNQLTHPLGTAICTASQLMTLDLSYNQIGGALPSCLTDIHTPMKWVFFDNNRIEEPLPSFDATNICGDCTFDDNLICQIPVSMGGLGCKLDLLPSGCAGGCSDRSCFDCLGTAHGSAVYDICDVCGGDDTSCLDCNGVPNGSGQYDPCDICSGDGSVCADCAGVPNGSAGYDRCDVCGGDGSSCLDCDGVPYGDAVYDLCDVCRGQNTACRDCTGVINGSSRFDECGVCNGDGLSCVSKLKQDIVMAQRQNATRQWIVLQIFLFIGMFWICCALAVCAMMLRRRGRK